MQKELPLYPDTRPVVALVVLSAALTCCCLTAAAVGAVVRWNDIRTVPPTPEVSLRQQPLQNIVPQDGAGPCTGHRPGAAARARGSAG